MFIPCIKKKSISTKMKTGKKTQEGICYILTYKVTNRFLNYHGYSFLSLEENNLCGITLKVVLPNM